MLKALIPALLLSTAAYGEDLREKWKAQAAQAQAEDAAKRERCGEDFDKIEIGMPKKKFLDCVEILDIKYRDAKVTVYEVGTSYVRVERNKVAAILSK